MTDSEPDVPDESTQTKSQNRRSHPRQQAKGEVICRTGKLGMGPQFKGKLVDLSQSGGCIRTKKEVKPGDEFEVEFVGIGSTRNYVGVVVVRQVKKLDTAEYVIGFQFLKRVPYEFYIRYAK